MKSQLKIPHESFIMMISGWKQKHALFVSVSLNANELLLPAPFSDMTDIALCVRIIQTVRVCGLKTKTTI